MSFELVIRSFPAPDGPVRHAAVPWDSETFGFAIHEVKCEPTEAEPLARHLPALLAVLSAARPVLVVAKVPIHAVGLGAVLARQGFYPVETLLELHVALPRFKPLVSRLPSSPRLRRATEADLPRLRALAAGAFQTDRFHLDANLPKAKADERYAAWITRGLTAGDPVYVYEDARQVLGFYHLQGDAHDGTTVRLSLAALDPAHQRLGLGPLMYQAVLKECQTLGYTVAYTHISAANLDVLNLFARLGFAFRNPVTTFHWYAPA